MIDFYKKALKIKNEYFYEQNFLIWFLLVILIWWYIKNKFFTKITFYNYKSFSVTILKFSHKCLWWFYNLPLIRSSLWSLIIQMNSLISWFSILSSLKTYLCCFWVNISEGSPYKNFPNWPRVYMGSEIKRSENSCSLIPNSSKFAKSTFQELTFYLNTHSLYSSIDFLSSDAKNSFHTLCYSNYPLHSDIMTCQSLNY